VSVLAPFKQPNTGARLHLCCCGATPAFYISHPLTSLHVGRKQSNIPAIQQNFFQVQVKTLKFTKAFIIPVVIFHLNAITDFILGLFEHFALTGSIKSLEDVGSHFVWTTH